MSALTLLCLERSGLFLRRSLACARRNAGCALFAATLLAPAAQAVTHELSAADFTLQRSTTPPPDHAAWTAQQLPDLWSISRPGTGGDSWYRLRFRLNEAPREEYAVYLPRLCMNAAVFLNGTFLGDGGSFDEPVARNWNRPLLFLAPPSLLHAGENVLYVRIHSPAYSLGSLSTVWVGPEDELRPAYEEKFFQRITLNQTATLIIAAMGLFMLTLWWQRRNDTMYGLFGLSALVWAFNASNQFIQTIPIPALLWERMVQSSFQVFIALLMLSLLRFLKLQQPLLEKLLWLMMIGSPLSLLLLPGDWLTTVALVWHSITLICSLLVGGYLLRATFRTPHFDTLLLTGALGINIVLAVHDLLQQAAILRNGDSHWLHYGGPLFFLVVGGIMTNRFVLALNQLERMNVELEQRVQAKHAELATRFEQVQHLHKQRAMLEERERIYRDLHDDVGAKLLGLAISAQRANQPREADLARSALQDLRDVVSRSAHSVSRLDNLLADWRAETEQRVLAAGIELSWDVPDEEQPLPVNPAAALNLSRILREAVSNALRHARATRLAVALAWQGDKLVLTVEDDGDGLPETGLRASRGMSSMRSRAAALGGSISWHPAVPRGCRVVLETARAHLRAEHPVPDAV